MGLPQYFAMLFNFFSARGLGGAHALATAKANLAFAPTAII